MIIETREKRTKHSRHPYPFSVVPRLVGAKVRQLDALLVHQLRHRLGDLLQAQLARKEPTQVLLPGAAAHPNRVVRYLIGHLRYQLLDLRLKKRKGKLLLGFSDCCCQRFDCLPSESACGATWLESGQKCSTLSVLHRRISLEIFLSYLAQVEAF